MRGGKPIKSGESNSTRRIAQTIKLTGGCLLSHSLSSHCHFVESLSVESLSVESLSGRLSLMLQDANAAAAEAEDNVEVLQTQIQAAEQVGVGWRRAAKVVPTDDCLPPTPTLTPTCTHYQLCLFWPRSRSVLTPIL